MNTYVVKCLEKGWGTRYILASKFIEESGQFSFYSIESDILELVASFPSDKFYVVKQNHLASEPVEPVKTISK